ncbi:MAG: AraC family transcriptional regulator [Desulfobacteraceae bacterium]|nr:MAG: AraC family transcriptional regulator [Desulfobacteraceae bacterium]
MSIQNLINSSFQALENKEDGLLVLNEENRFMLLKSSITSDLEATFYEPALCLILQGSKEVTVGARVVEFGVGESLIVSHELPVLSRITRASEDEPYIALVLGIDLSVIRSLYEEFGESALLMGGSRSLEVDQTAHELSDALYRLVSSSQNKIDALVLFPQILREVHFRLLQAPYGGMLRELLRVDSRASNISKAISIIRNQFMNSLSVTELARSVGMSTSSFHQHFKSITESTPLQYQKELRLLEARRRITTQGESVTAAALNVGYESPNQFSREYTRKFGVNPSSDSRCTFA